MRVEKRALSKNGKKGQKRGATRKAASKPGKKKP